MVEGFYHIGEDAQFRDTIDLEMMTQRARTLPPAPPTLPPSNAVEMMQALNAMAEQRLMSKRLARSRAVRAFADGQPIGIYENMAAVRGEPDHINIVAELKAMRSHGISAKGEIPNFIPRDQTNPGGFFRVLELLATTLYATTGFFRGLVNLAQGEEEDANPFVEMWQGFTHQQTETWEDIFKNMGWDGEDNASSTSRWWLGFAADVLLDPINLLTAGTWGAGRAVLTKGAKRIALMSHKPVKFGKTTMMADTALDNISKAIAARIKVGKAPIAKDAKTLEMLKRWQKSWDEKKQRALAAMAEKGEDVADLVKSGALKDLEEEMLQLAIKSNVDEMVGTFIMQSNQGDFLRARLAAAKTEREFWSTAFLNDGEWATEVMSELLRLEGRLKPGGKFHIEDAIQWIEKDARKLVDPGGLGAQIPFMPSTRLSFIRSDGIDRAAFATQEAVTRWLVKTGQALKRTLPESVFTVGRDVGGVPVRFGLKMATGLSKIGKKFERLLGIDVRRSPEAQSLLRKHGAAMSNMEQQMERFTVELYKDVPEEGMLIMYNAVQDAEEAAQRARNKLTKQQIKEIDEAGELYSPVEAEAKIMAIRHNAIEAGLSTEAGDQMIETVRTTRQLFHDLYRLQKEEGIELLARDYYIPLVHKENVKAAEVLMEQSSEAAAAGRINLTDRQRYVKARTMTRAEAKDLGLTPITDMRVLVRARLVSAHRAVLNRRLMRDVVGRFGLHRRQLDKLLRETFGPEFDTIGRDLLDALDDGVPELMRDFDALKAADPRVADLDDLIQTGNWRAANQWLEEHPGVLSVAHAELLKDFDKQRLLGMGATQEYLKRMQSAYILKVEPIVNAKLAPAWKAIASLSDEQQRVTAVAMSQALEARLRTLSKYEDVVSARTLMGEQRVVDVGEHAGAPGVRMAILDGMVDSTEVPASVAKAIELEYGKVLDDTSREINKLVDDVYTAGSVKQAYFDERLKVLLARMAPMASLEKHIDLTTNVLTAAEHRASGMRSAVAHIDELEQAAEPDQAKIAMAYESFFADFASDPLLQSTWGRFTEAYNLGDIPVPEGWRRTVFGFIKDLEEIRTAVKLKKRGGFLKQAILAEPGMGKETKAVTKRLVSELSKLAGGDSHLRDRYLQLLFEAGGTRAGAHWQPIEGVVAILRGHYASEGIRFMQHARQAATDVRPDNVLKEFLAKQKKPIGPIFTGDPAVSDEMKVVVNDALNRIEAALKIEGPRFGIDVTQFSTKFRQLHAKLNTLSVDPNMSLQDEWADLEEILVEVGDYMDLVLKDPAHGPVNRQMMEEYFEIRRQEQIAMRELVERGNVAASDPILHGLRDPERLMTQERALEGLDELDEVLDQYGARRDQIIADAEKVGHAEDTLTVESQLDAVISEDITTKSIHQIDSQLRDDSRQFLPAAAKEIRDQEIAAAEAFRTQARNELANAEREREAAGGTLGYLVDRLWLTDTLDRMAPKTRDLKRIAAQVAQGFTGTQQADILRSYMLTLFTHEFHTKFPNGGTIGDFYRTMQEVILDGPKGEWKAWKWVKDNRPPEEMANLARQLLEGGEGVGLFGGTPRSIDETRAIYRFTGLDEPIGPEGVRDTFLRLVEGDPELMSAIELTEGFLEEVERVAVRDVQGVASVERDLAELLATSPALQPSRIIRRITAMREEAAYIRAFDKVLQKRLGDVGAVRDSVFLHEELKQSIVRGGQLRGAAQEVLDEADDLAMSLSQDLRSGEATAATRARDLGAPEDLIGRLTDGSAFDKRINALRDRLRTELQAAWRTLGDPAGSPKSLATIRTEGARAALRGQVGEETFAKLELAAPEEIAGLLRDLDTGGPERARYWLAQMGVIANDARLGGELGLPAGIGREMAQELGTKVRTGASLSRKVRQSLVKPAAQAAEKLERSTMLYRMAEAKIQTSGRRIKMAKKPGPPMPVQFASESAIKFRSSQILHQSLNLMLIRDKFMLLSNAIREFPSQETRNLLRARAVAGAPEAAAPLGKMEGPRVAGPKFERLDDGRVSRMGRVMPEAEAARMSEMAHFRWGQFADDGARVMGRTRRILQDNLGIDIAQTPNPIALHEELVRREVQGVSLVKTLDEAGEVAEASLRIDYDVVRANHGPETADALEDAVRTFGRSMDDEALESLAGLAAVDIQLKQVDSMLARVAGKEDRATLDAKKALILFAITGGNRIDDLTVLEAAYVLRHLEQKYSSALSMTGIPLKEGQLADLDLLKAAAIARGLMAADVGTVMNTVSKSRHLIQSVEELELMRVSDFKDIPDFYNGKPLPTDELDLMLPKNIVEIIRNEITDRTTLNNPIIRNFLKMFDQFTNAFKGAVTWPFPAFHFRNIIDGQARAALAIGIRAFDVKRNKGLWDMLNGASGYQTVKLASGNTYEINNALYREILSEQGLIVQWGQRIDLIPTDPNDLSPGSIDYVFGKYADKIRGADAATRGAVKGKMTAFAERSDNVFRAAVFHHFLERGVPLREAARVAQKYMFDYAYGLTTFEREWMRRIFPFYNFFRSNVPLALQTLYRKPGVVSFFGKTRNILGEYEPMEELVPTYVRKNWRFFPKYNEEKRRIEIWSYGKLLSWEDIDFLSGLEFWRGNQFSDALFQEMLSKMNPLLKIFPEFVAGKNFFLNRNIPEDITQTAEVGYVNTLPLLRNFLNTREVIVGDEKFYRVDGRRLLAIQNLHTSRYYSVARTVFGDNDMNLWEKWAPFLTGLRLQYIDLERRYVHATQVSNFHRTKITRAIEQGDTGLLRRLTGEIARTQYEQQRVSRAYQNLRLLSQGKAPDQPVRPRVRY